MKKLLQVLYILALLFPPALLPAQKINVGSSRLSGNQVIASATFKNTVGAIVADGGGKNGNMINYYNGSEWSIIPTVYNSGSKLDTFRLSISSSIVFDMQGALWLSAHGGLFRYQNNSWTHFSLGDTLDKYREYTNMAFDKSGNIWMIGTVSIPKWTKNDNGTIISLIDKYSEVLRLDGKVFTKVQSGNVLEIGGYERIAVTSENIVVVTVRTPKNNLLFFDGQQWTTSNLESEYGANYIQDVSQIVADEDGGLWFAYKATHWDKYVSGGLSYFKNGVWKHFTKADGMIGSPTNPNETIEALGLCIDKDKNKWIGTPLGIVRINRDMKVEIMDENRLEKMIPFSTLYLPTFGSENISTFPTGSAPFTIYNATATEDGKIWFGTGGGMISYAPQTTDITEERQNPASGSGIYPNPAARGETISIPVADNSANVVTVTNVIGQIIWKQGGIESGSFIQIPTSGLASGAYTVSILNRSNVQTQRFIIIE